MARMVIGDQIDALCLLKVVDDDFKNQPAVPYDFSSQTCDVVFPPPPPTQPGNSRGPLFDKKGRADRMLRSDRGWQYRMARYGKRLEMKGIRQSMSRKGNCPDNAMAENFFALVAPGRA